MKIVFLFSDNFPGSSAYSNRIHSLAKGLIYHGNEVEASVVYPGNWSKSNELAGKKGVYDTVPFNYYCAIKFKPKSRILQVIVGVYGIIHFFFKWLFKFGKDKPDYIIACSSSLMHLSVLYVLAKTKGIKILREYNEYPKFIQRKSNYFAKTARYRLLDGFIFMTKRLEVFFKEDLKMNQKSIIVNMTVDTDRFDGSITQTVESSNRITMVGDILGEKDGVGNLISSFAIIHKAFPALKLVLVGNITDSKRYEQRLVKVKELELSNFVEFTGNVSRNEIPELMKQSRLLLLPRPTSLQAESGFPTKLGEYLSSGIPVVVTNTGEISNFLVDMETAFIVEPDNIEAFAKKVIFALENPTLASQIATRGKACALESFDYIVQTQLLNQFLKSF